MGLSHVSLGVIALFMSIELLKLMLTPESSTKTRGPVAVREHRRIVRKCRCGLGGSFTALFGQDFLGKNGHGLEEDDKRNPAYIADNVGDKGQGVPEQPSRGRLTVACSKKLCDLCKDSVH